MNNMLLVWVIYQKIYGPAPCLWDAGPYFNEDAIEIIKYRMQEQMVVIRDAQMKVERARQALNDAIVERKTYEKLREKAFEDFKIELNAQEQKEVDELVSYTFGTSKTED